MSSSDPNDLEPRLSSDPLHKKGFTDELLRKIEQSVDNKTRTEQRRKPLLTAVGVGTVAAAVIFLFPWSMLLSQNKTSSVELMSKQQDTAAYTSAPPTISSAVLIGLRTEHEEKDSSRKLSTIRYSTYRTMLVAPVRGELKKTAEGSGILMPYKRDFWKIDSLTQSTSQDEYHYLSARLAGQPVVKEDFKDNPDEEIHHTETLVYAGNQYLSVAESEETWNNNTASRNDRVWVKTLPQLTEARSLNFAKQREDNTPHVTLTDIFGTSINGTLDDLSGKRQMIDMPTEITGKNWTIVRSPGSWIAMVAESMVPEGFQPERYILHEFPKALPEKVIAHDVLCCSWSEIQSRWPKATDALSSPMNDLTVLFEEDKLRFFPYGQAPDTEPLLTIDLQPGEQLVMAQWATDHYVQEWIDKVDSYLNN
ncbi:hypothetical protein [Paenibacillus eucommiae]|uniref:Uncharacterized protein n=1 Tax=Paenibacillus eucommiae TaxID=1355755 RepID=A0ABS4IY26_9BACL|nr:hypothetical protein [Paenibacillus eucommiae]MBP1992487.1 hypothetical protein [Paenibacillus eucommiae]